MQQNDDIAGKPPSAALLRTQVNIFGAWVDPISREDALQIILTWCKLRAQQYVVTPNLNICRLLRSNPDLASIFHNAGLSLPDGWPVVAASRLTAYRIRRRVTGSDFVVPLCKLLSEHGLSAFLLGSSPEVLKSASEKINALAGQSLIVGTYSPPFGFENDKRQIEWINEQITMLRPHAVIVALGCPKQELWMASNAKHLPIGVAIGVGGTLDFLASRQRRAPQIFQRAGLEWLWRACTQPMRLGKRYVADAASLPILLFSHMHRHFINKRDITRQRPLPI